MKITEPQVRLINSMGDDSTVVNAARVSFHKESSQFSKEQNDKLIRYLAKHGHWTPFGHCTATFYCKAPIFVARQLVKHQVGLVWNEVSRRYVDDEPRFYIPLWRRRPDKHIKQGSGEPFLEDDQEYLTDQVIKNLLVDISRTYDYLVKVWKVAPEQARMILPLNTHTEWYWTGSLAAWARVCNLRCKEEAQEETRIVCEKIDEILRDVWPVSWSALRDE